MKSKAQVAKALKNKGIPLPDEDSLGAMLHRFNTWDSPQGFLLRRIKTAHHHTHNLPESISIGAVIWMPDSEYTKNIIRSGVMWPMGRTKYNSKYTLVDIPMDA
tara:strand:+ start:11497 stop:11808 length:312 start_codon:yes stop_codon:yes gene_type:complete